MDIRLSEHEKRIVKLGMILFRKKIGKKASKENISKYLRQSKNKEFNEFLGLIDHVSENTKSSWQRLVSKEYTEFALFLAINHPKLRKGLLGLLKTFTKYKNIEIDIEPCLGKLDKYMLEHVLKYIVKHFSSRRTYSAIMSESLTSINAIAQYFMSNIDKALVGVNDDFMQRALKTFAWFGVWVGVNDTAYRHQFYYMLNKCGNEQIMKLSEKYYREPDAWFINLYQEGVDETRKLWDKNKIPHHKTSLLEAPCVVKNQRDVIEKYTKTRGVK